MFNINRSHFIMIKSSGKTLNIFHKESAGICISTLNKKGIWNTPTVIVRNAVPEFHAYMDSSDNLHILYQDINGSVTYLYNDSTDWKSTPITVGRNSLHGLKHLWIGGFEKNIYLFYTTEYPGNSFLYYQTGSLNGTLLEPHVLDSIEISGTAFRIAVESSGNLCIFYIQKTPASKASGFRLWNSLTCTWSEFNVFKEEADNSKLNVISTYYDSGNNLHFLYNETKNMHHTLYYNVKLNGEATWQKDEAIAESDQPYINSALATSNKLLIVYWIINNTIYYRISSNDGAAWSEQATYSPLEGKHIYCMSYTTNVSDDQLPSSVLYLPGSYVDGYKLAFLYDLKNLNTAREKAVTAANNTNETSPASNISEPVNTSFDKNNTQLAAEIEMLNIRQSLLEKEFSKLRADFDVINMLISSVDKPTETLVTEPAQKSPVLQEVKLMPGAGFSFVTPEYLKSLKNQK